MSAPEHTDEKLDYRRYFAILRRYWLFVALTAVLSGVAAFAFASAQTPRYAATAQVMISPRLAESLVGITTSTADMSTELVLLRGTEVRSEVAQRLGSPVEPTFEVVDESKVIAITVESTNPELAALAANTYAEAFVDLRREQTQQDITTATGELTASIESLSDSLALTELALLEQPGNVVLEAERSALVQERIRQQLQLDQLQQQLALRTGGTQLSSTASVPGTPFEPQPRQAAITAALLGLLVAATIVLLADYLDDSIRSSADIDAALGGDPPVVAHVPHVPMEGSGPSAERLVAQHRPQSPAAEAYRTLRTTVQFASLPQPHTSLMVTSPISAEGKTMTVANLGIVMAQAGQRVVIVDADLRRPQLGNYFGFDRTPGLTELAAGSCSFGDAVRRPEGLPNLAVVPAGSIPPNPSEVLGSAEVGQLLQSLSEHADVVLVDAPPVLPVTDALILSNLVQHVLLIAMVGRSTRRNVTNAVDGLRRVSAPMTGIVLNDASGRGFGYGYGYGYGYGGYESHDSAAETAQSAQSGSS